MLNPVDLNQETVDPELLRLGYGHTIGAFSFWNQAGDKISDTDLTGSVWVAEYFFTTCGSICPIMNQQMQRVHAKYSGDSRLNLLSFTVDPGHDSVPVLKEYAENHGAHLPQWHFLTGEKKDLYNVARKYFFLLKPAEAQNLGDAGSDFIHTNNFVLVDSKRRIRGYYDGTDAQEVNKLMRDIDRLLENN